MGVRYAATVLRGKGERAPNAKPAPRAAAEETARGGSPGGGGRAAELARTNESRKEEAKSFSVKRPKPTERRRRSLAEAKRSELCSPRRSAALRPRPSGRRPGSRCGDGTRCSPVRPSENGRTLMCVTEAAHAACGPAGSLFRPRGSAPELCLQSPASRLGAASQPSLSSFPRRAAAPPGASPGEPSELLGLVCLQTLRIHVSARLPFRARLPGLIFGLWAVPP